MARDLWDDRCSPFSFDVNCQGYFKVQLLSQLDKKEELH